MIRWTSIEATRGFSVTSFAVGTSLARPLCLAATPSGLLASADGGRSWQKAPGVLGNLPVMAACLSPTWESDSLVFLGSAGGIAYTRDFQTLNASRMPQEGIDVVSLTASPNFSQDGVLFAGTLDYGVLHSTNRGESWKARHYGLQDLGVLALAVSPNFARDELALVGTSTAIFRTPNGGLAWREASFPGEEEAILSIAFSSGYPADPLIVAGTEEGRLFASQDAGRNWANFGALEPDTPINALVFLAHPEMGNLLVAAVGSSICITADRGAHWDTFGTTGDVLSLAYGYRQNGLPFILAGLQEEGIWLGE